MTFNICQKKMIIFKILRKERLSFLAKMKSKEPIYSSASLNNWKKVGGGWNNSFSNTGWQAVSIGQWSLKRRDANEVNPLIVSDYCLGVSLGFSAERGNIDGVLWSSWVQIEWGVQEGHGD